MKYKTLTIERGVRGRRFKKPLTIRIPERQNRGEEKLLQYILESLNRRSSLVPFTLSSLSMMEVARHLLFNRTGSEFSLYGYMVNFNYFCTWIKAKPDQLMNRCRTRNGNTSPEGIYRMAKILDEYIDHLRARKLSPGTVSNRLKNVVTIFHINGIGLKLPFGLTVWHIFYERAPSREELQQILDLADLRERVIITILAVSGLRVGTLLRLQYRHVRKDLERGIIPIHIHIEAELTKGKRGSYDTFLNEEAAECLKAYLITRRKGTRKIPPEQINDESPLIRSHRFKGVRTVALVTVQAFVHDLFVKIGLLDPNSMLRKCQLRTHSLRRFFRTQMASLDVDRDYIDFMMGHTVKDRYHDVRMKGVEYLRGVYLTSGMRIRPKIKMNKMDALKEIMQTWGLDPQKILSAEAFAQITPTTKQEEADNKETLFPSEASVKHQPTGSLPEPTGA